MHYNTDSNLVRGPLQYIVVYIVLISLQIISRRDLILMYKIMAAAIVNTIY